MKATIPPPTNVNPIAGFNQTGVEGADATAQPIRMRAMPNKIPCHDSPPT